MKDIQDLQILMGSSTPNIHTNKQNSMDNNNKQLNYSNSQNLSQHSSFQNPYNIQSKNQNELRQTSYTTRTMGPSINEGPMMKGNLKNPGLVMNAPMLRQTPNQKNQQNFNGVSQDPNQSYNNIYNTSNLNQISQLKNSHELSKNGFLNYVWLFKNMVQKTSPNFRQLINLNEVLTMTESFEIYCEQFLKTRDFSRILVKGLQNYCSQIPKNTNEKNDQELSCLQMMDNLNKY